MEVKNIIKDFKIQYEKGYGNTFELHFGEVDDETVRNAKIAIKEFLKGKDHGEIIHVRTGPFYSIVVFGPE